MSGKLWLGLQLRSPFPPLENWVCAQANNHHADISKALYGTGSSLFLQMNVLQLILSDNVHAW